MKRWNDRRLQSVENREGIGRAWDKFIYAIFEVGTWIMELGCVRSLKRFFQLVV